MDNSNVEHNSQNAYYRSTVGAAEAGSNVRLGLRLKTGEKIKQVLLHTWAEGTGEEWTNLSTKDKEDAPERFYSIELKMPEKGGLLWYYFIIVTTDRTYYYGNNPEQLGGIGQIYYDYAPPAFQITVYKKGSKTPDWFKHTVMYQIFPDRFFRAGNEIVEKRKAVYHGSWKDDPFYHRDPVTNDVLTYDYYGGNLRGIEEKLDYLKEMGISVIYLNPIFESESNHHYDTADYHKVDKTLGTEDDFKHLIEVARSKGIAIILDGVFSHTGSDSIYFNRYGNYDSLGAYQSKESPYHDWYIFRDFPNDYESWWNFANLPNIKEDTPSYIDFIIKNSDSVLHHWMRDGIAGWRLDVIDELPPEFAQAFYSELKRINPDAVMIGEVWEDASNKVAYGIQRQYFCGYEMDSSMNYPFREHMFNFIIGNIDGRTCMRRMESLRENYPKENFYATMNLIASHDILRPVTYFGEAPAPENMTEHEQVKFKLDAEAEKLGKARLKMAALWQMTYPGVPCIYYGDEIGLQGFKDPSNRRPYDWEDGDKELLETYKKFIAARNNNVVLRTGEFLPLPSYDDILAYARVIRNGRDVFDQEAKNDAYLVAFNRSRYESRFVSFDVSDFANGIFVDAFDETRKFPVKRKRVEFELKPLEGVLLHHVPQQKHYDRRAGILLHPTSLPSKYGIGDLGNEAFEFVDYLKAAGQTIWQILPLNPVGFGYSPYQSPSAFAGNPMLISIDKLIEQNFLAEGDVNILTLFNTSTVEFERVSILKSAALKKAFKNFKARLESDEALKADFENFRADNSFWLEDYALFTALKIKNNDAEWSEWDEPIKKRDAEALAEVAKTLTDEILYTEFEQYIFNVQWQALHKYAQENGVKIFGDMPIFVAGDSADVWANQKLFQIDEDGRAKKVAGVPPDYFSPTGQLWGNPQYDWDAMAEENYHWWMLRFKQIYKLVDIVRIDHFRGFEAYWSVDGNAENAMVGEWVKGPGKPFFDIVKKQLGDMQIVAEDLGFITNEVEELRQECGFPGMKILQFELVFNEDGRIGFLAPENSITYTGTHDNNTVVGWFMEDVDNLSRATIASLLGADPRRPDDVCQKLIEFAYASDSRFTILPMQDVLKLDSKSRMNTPGTVGTNWGWRLKPDYKLDAEAGKFKALCQKYMR